MRWWGHVLILVLVLGVAGVAMFQSVLHGEREEFEKRVDRLREAGELVDLEPIYGAMIPEHEDARPLLQSVIERAQPILDSVAIPEEGSVEEQELASRLEHLLPDLDRALARPRCSLPRKDAETNPFAAYLVEELIDATAASKDGPLAAASRGIRWAELIESRTQHMAMLRACVFHGVCARLRRAWIRPDFDARAVRVAFAPRMRAFAASFDFAQICGAERGRMIRFVDDWLANGFPKPTWGRQPPDWVRTLSKNSLWGPMMYRDANRTLDLWARVIRETAALSDTSLARLQRLADKREDLSRMWILTSRAQRRPALIARRLLLVAAMSQRMRVALALLEHRAEHGEYPESLDALAFEGGVPQDPISERPFGYESSGAGVRLSGETWGKNFGPLFRAWELPG